MKATMNDITMPVEMTTAKDGNIHDITQSDIEINTLVTLIGVAPCNLHFYSDDEIAPILTSRVVGVLNYSVDVKMSIRDWYLDSLSRWLDR